MYTVRKAHVHNICSVFRYEELIRNQNHEMSDIQKSKRHTVNESLQQLLTQNSSLKSNLHRTLVNVMIS